MFTNSIKNYIVNKIKPDYLIFVDDKIFELSKRSDFRKFSKTNSFVYKNEKQIRIYKKFFKEYQNCLSKII